MGKHDRSLRGNTPIRFYIHLVRFLLIFMISFPVILSGCSSPYKTPKHTFRINNIREKFSIDGKLDEPFWKKAEPMGDFRVDADPGRLPGAETLVYIAYDDESLLVAFECNESMMKKLKADMKSQNAEVWKDDYCELQIFSRPETPYYSPFMQRLDYMNANNSVRTQRHFIVTAAGEKRDGNIYKVGPHTSYITDDSWEGKWESAVSYGNSGYYIEMAVPWLEIGGKPGPGHTVKLHFIRHQTLSAKEIASFNWYSGENIQVESFDPASFIQEHPVLFAPVKFENDYAVLTRYIEASDPWKVERSRTEYKNVLTKRPVRLRAAHFYLGISGFLLPEKIRKQYDAETWAKEEDNFITELGRAGAYGPFLPGFINKKGEAYLDSLYRLYDMKFGYHGYASSEQAKKAGAVILAPGGSVAFFDPHYVEIKNNNLAGFLKKYGKKPWLFEIRGQDEPFNQIATLRMQGTYEMVNRELKATYGIDMGVPPGIPDTLYQDQPVDDNSRTVPDHETALSRIATFRWLNRKFADVARGEYKIVRTYAPGKLYQAYNRNSVADMDFLDQSLIYDITDFFSADPYPSFCIYVYGAARSRYHVGFTSKLVTDLAAGKPTQMIIQGCYMIQRLSTTENVREWASQAVKAGVTMLDWWGNPRLDHPDVYREMLRLSRLWKDLPALDIPENADIAVLFSDDSRAAAGDEAFHSHYTLHGILGEKLGAWFSFISENHVRRGLQNLSEKKLVIAPQLSYLSKAFADILIHHVEDGATLVILDPGALTFDIESGPLTEQRMKLLGTDGCHKRAAAQMIPAAAGSSRFKSVRSLPLRPLPIVGDTLNARDITVPSDATILFTYPDGKPSAYTRSVGRGEVIVFAAMPFCDSEFVMSPSGWDDLFSSLIEELGIAQRLPIWDFMFPETGGEVETFDQLVPLKGI